MKFLSKNAESIILAQNLTYKKNAAENNKNLKELLVQEQINFCAYTEKCLEPLDSIEVEHFNSSLKYKDDYYNYYAVIRNANLYKQDEKYANASFFQNLFFQNKETFKARINFKSNIYYEINEADTEARDLIDFLGFNHPTLSEQRSKHIKRLKETFEEARYSNEKIINYFRNNKDQLSFSTAIEHEFGIDVDEILNN
jgi:hypothetical protein